MEIEIVEKEKNSLSVKFKGMDEGLANLAVEKTWEEKEVKSASIVLDHPLTANPVITVKSSDAKEAMEKAFSSIEHDAQAAVKIAKGL